MCCGGEYPLMASDCLVIARDELVMAGGFCFDNRCILWLRRCPAPTEKVQMLCTRGMKGKVFQILEFATNETIDENAVKQMRLGGSATFFIAERIRLFIILNNDNRVQRFSFRAYAFPDFTICRKFIQRVQALSVQQCSIGGPVWAPNFLP